MTNNFYNIDIHKYKPPESTNFTQTSGAVEKKSEDIQYSGDVNISNGQEENKYLPSSRLNALDSTILVNESYHNIEDSKLKTEYQITKLESELEFIDRDIERAKSINDYQKVDILTMRKHSILAKLEELNKTYGAEDVTTKLSNDIVGVFSKKPTLLSKFISKGLSFMSSKILPKVSKKYSSGQEIKTALNKLETINKNVDELVNNQMPYGEADERYDMLSEYLNRANVIHFNISKTIGTPTFLDTISSIDKEKFNTVKKNSATFGNMTPKTTQPKPKIE